MKEDKYTEKTIQGIIKPFYDGKATSLQLNSVCSEEVGNRIVIEDKVYDIKQSSIGGCITVTLFPTNTNYTVSAEFSKNIHLALYKYNKGDKIKIDGVISIVDRYYMNLEDCKIL